MLLAAAATIAVAVTTNDEFHVPVVERTHYEARCHERTVRLTEQNSVLALTVGDKVVDISATAFAKSYANGSFLGRFVVACRKGSRLFVFRFVGVEVPKEGTIVPAQGSVSINDMLEIDKDTAIAQDQWQPYEFNKRRNEYFGQ